MVNACSAFNCTKRDTAENKAQGITFHRFPLNKERRFQWIRAVRRANWQPSRSSVLCSNHFTDDCFDRFSPFRVRLKDHAVPSIFKGFPDYLQQVKKTRKPPKKSIEDSSPSAEVLSDDLNEPSVTFNDNPISLIDFSNYNNNASVSITDLPAPSVSLSGAATFNDNSSDKALLKSQLSMLEEKNEKYREKIKDLNKKIQRNQKTIENLHQLISEL